MITIIDYGMGNLRSVQKSFEKIGTAALISQNPAEIKKAEAIVLPGVGSFGAALKNLEKFKLIDPIKASIEKKTPFLGICLGLQILFETSEESPGVKGLGIFKGKVQHFYSEKSFPKADLPIPHMGWNQIEQQKKSLLFDNIPEKAFFYFVHSYYVAPQDENIISGRSNYGVPFTAAIEKGNIHATQFHPEKSTPWGLQILKNFVASIKKS